jgi:hypothetical protein
MIPSARLFGLALAAIAISSRCPSAHADTPPSAWDVARDPPARGRWELHVRVQQLLHGVLLDGAAIEGLGPASALPLAAARAELESAGAASSPDVRLRFD